MGYRGVNSLLERFSLTIVFLLICSPGWADELADQNRLGSAEPHVPAASTSDSTALRLPIRLVQSNNLSSAADGASTADMPIPLKFSRDTQEDSSESVRLDPRQDAIKTVVTSLAVVLGLFLVVVWISRRTRPRGYGSLPGTVVDTLGRAPLSGKQEMHLVRVGNKLLLLSVTPTSAETLTEITDPVEIQRLTQICEAGHGSSVSQSFREVFSQLAHSPSPSAHNLSG